MLTFLAILLAIAVPTFLTQKDAAQATAAKANIQATVHAIESCAAGNITGAYVEEPPGADCLDKEHLETYEKSLANVDVRIVAIGTQGYEVSATVPGESGAPITYTERHEPDGRIEKTCTTSSTCPDGTW